MEPVVGVKHKETGKFYKYPQLEASEPAGEESKE
jgi:hypothetical protein